MGENHRLDAQTAFVAISLFDILRGNLNWLPWLITDVIKVLPISFCCYSLPVIYYDIQASRFKKIMLNSAKHEFLVLISIKISSNSAIFFQAQINLTCYFDCS